MCYRTILFFREILNINREYRDIKMKANRYVQEEKLQKKLEKEGKKETELGAFTKEAMAMKQRAQTTIGAFGIYFFLDLLSFISSPLYVTDLLSASGCEKYGERCSKLPRITRNRGNCLCIRANFVLTPTL